MKTTYATLDSQILSFALKRNPPGPNNVGQDVEEMYRRSRYLINELRDEGLELMIPSVVLSEILIGVEVNRHGEFVAALSTTFAIVPYDQAAASLAAELWMYNRTASPDVMIERKYLKSDVLIVATAKTAGARYFYSGDRKCRLLAERAGMTPRDIPVASRYLFPLNDDLQALGSDDQKQGKATKKRSKKSK